MTDVEREKEIYKVTIVGGFVNFALVIFKFIAGVLGGSAAMIADAVHSLSDFITDIVVIVFVKISSRPTDENHDYGHGKFETLATTIIGIVLFAVGIGIFWSGSEKIYAVVSGESLGAPGWIAFFAAVLSIASKEALYQYTVYKGRGLDSKAVIANAWHHRSDALSSIGAALGIGGAILLGENWRVLDPIAAVIVSIFIIKVSVQLVIPCLGELLEKSLPSDTENEIVEILSTVDGVSAPHNLKTRRIGNRIAIEVHIRMRGDISLTQAHNATLKIERLLKQRFGAATHIGIHVEPLDEK